MELDKKKLRKMFPSLTQELQSENNKVPVNSVRTDTQTAENAANTETFIHYVPDVIDFIRRCDTQKQAEEIITYMEKRSEIDSEYANRLRVQLKQKGLRSFGSKKEEGYYLNHGEQ